MKNRLFNWIYGVMWENHSNRTLESIEALINDCLEKSKAEIISTLKIKEDLYQFRMELQKIDDTQINCNINDFIKEIRTDFDAETGEINKLIKDFNNCEYTGECDYKK